MSAKITATAKGKQHLQSLLPILRRVHSTRTTVPFTIGLRYVTVSVLETPPNSHQSFCAIGAVVIVVAISANVATAPPCMLSMGLQSPGTASISKMASDSMLPWERVVFLAEIIFIVLMRSASNPLDRVSKGRLLWRETPPHLVVRIQIYVEVALHPLDGIRD